MRQYGEVPPWLAAANTPAVSATTGLGTNGAAAVQTPDSGGFGDILVYIVKSDWNANGSVSIKFPSTPPTLFIAGEDAFGAITQATVGNVVTLSWSTANFVPKSQPYQIHYEWSTSK